mmetsp:Transcript_13691/g.39968  ORF Transcript_13691/g.39968 Transcript_13691/m.39968 type:complete len:409 (-) Transcript_13691:1437-2663(-)
MSDAVAEPPAAPGLSALCPPTSKAPSSSFSLSSPSTVMAPRTIGEGALDGDRDLRSPEEPSAVETAELRMDCMERFIAASREILGTDEMFSLSPSRSSPLRASCLPLAASPSTTSTAAGTNLKVWVILRRPFRDSEPPSPSSPPLLSALVMDLDEDADVMSPGCCPPGGAMDASDDVAERVAWLPVLFSSEGRGLSSAPCCAPSAASASGGKPRSFDDAGVSVISMYLCSPRVKASSSASLPLRRRTARSLNSWVTSMFLAPCCSSWRWMLDRGDRGARGFRCCVLPRGPLPCLLDTEPRTSPVVLDRGLYWPLWLGYWVLPLDPGEEASSSWAGSPPAGLNPTSSCSSSSSSSSRNKVGPRTSESPGTMHPSDWVAMIPRSRSMSGDDHVDASLGCSAEASPPDLAP